MHRTGPHAAATPCALPVPPHKHAHCKIKQAILHAAQHVTCKTLPYLPLTCLCLCTRSGRRNASVIYVITYSLSCVTKHSPAFHVLMLGRILGGIATSLLFSSFESWLVAEHFKRGFSGER